MLEQNFYGNSVLHWLIAVGVAFAISVVLLTIRMRVVRLFESRHAGARGKRTAITLAAVRATRPWFLVVVGIYLGAQLVTLAPKAGRLLDHVALIATIMQSAVWASKAIRAWLAHQVAEKRQTDAGAATTVSVLGFFLQLGLWSVVVLLALENLGFNITALLAGLGVGGIAVALATQSILGDIFASIIIALDRPFSIGDFIVLDDMMGTVENIGLKTTRLRSLSGEQIIVANADLLKTRLRNFQRLRERRVQFTLGIAPDTPADKLAKVPAILREAIEAQPDVRFERAHFKEFGKDQLLFEAAYYISDKDYNRYMDIQQAINLTVYSRLQQEGAAPVRKPAPDQRGKTPAGQARQPEEHAPARQAKPKVARAQAQSEASKRAPEKQAR